MKKVALLAMIAAVALSGCAHPWYGKGRTGAAVPTAIGSPTIEFSQALVAGKPALAVVIDQEPLFLNGAATVTWTLPDDGATYKDFRYRVDARIKSLGIGPGGQVVYTPLKDPQVIQRELVPCRQLTARSFECPLPGGLDRSSLYSYTISFDRNGQRFEVDPSMIP